MPVLVWMKMLAMMLVISIVETFGRYPASIGKKKREEPLEHSRG